VASPEIQVVSNEAGEPTAVILPIDLWREIASERETAYLLQSETMRARLLAALHRNSQTSFQGALAKSSSLNRIEEVLKAAVVERIIALRT
jgi:PHD/YefM family antitoxin component YafN of YafNO toxin-antitoxin module